MEFSIEGRWADHPAARALAGEVSRVHRRYAVEVVGTFRLCPFVRDEGAVDAAFGKFVVVVDSELDADLAVRASECADTSVVHLVYPRIQVPPRTFERFAGEVGAALRRTRSRAPVLATFHPEMSGDPSEPHRLVGLLRRAPDPFIQFVPEGLHEGGTTFIGALDDLELAKFAAQKDPARDNFERLRGAGLTDVLARLTAIREDRDASYAGHLAALAAL